MDVNDLSDPERWARQQWGGADLGDARRNVRAVRLGAALAAQPGASLPAQAGDWGDLKAAYRLLNEADVTHQALGQPHWDQTRRRAVSATGVVLFLQDTTELDFTGRRKAQGLGHIGNGGGAGLALHTCLGVLPGSSGAQVLGVAAQKVWARQQTHRGKETRTERHKRPTEADVWAETVEAVGPPPPEAQWVSVGDRGSDIFSFLSGARQARWHCLARLCQDRVLLTGDGERVRLRGWLRSLPPQAHKPVVLRGRDGQPGRTAELSVSWAPAVLQPPRTAPQEPPVAGWCLRCWEERAPKEGAPLEWLLFSTVPVAEEAAALRLLDWYACRWVIEEYHKCLKSGCVMEQRQLRTARRLEAVLGFLAVVAVRLLQLRALSREAPDLLAQGAVPPAMLLILAARLKKPPSATTRGEFWRVLAGLGGFLGRWSDGDPGWQTLWRGWQRLQDMCWGAEFAAEEAQRCG